MGPENSGGGGWRQGVIWGGQNAWKLMPSSPGPGRGAISNVWYSKVPDFWRLQLRCFRQEFASRSFFPELKGV